MGATRRISRSIRRAVDQSAGPGDAGEGTRRTVNVSDPSNVVIAANVGEGGATHGVSTAQRVRIRQDGQERYEETETTETRFP